VSRGGAGVRARGGAARCTDCKRLCYEAVEGKEKGGPRKSGRPFPALLMSVARKRRECRRHKSSARVASYLCEAEVVLR
jgi:hypothetical protein